MTRGDIEAQILKNLIMSNEFVSQEELKKVVNAMEQAEIETRPQFVSQNVETR